MNQAAPAPRWLTAALACGIGLFALQALVEVLLLRPGYGVGDETARILRTVTLDPANGMNFKFAQGALQSAALWLWIRAFGNSLRVLHLLNLGAMALEGFLLWKLARRWFSEEAAAWAVLADLLCAATWMRARSILSHVWLPAELAGLALLAGRVRSRRWALLWGAAAGALVLDYEGALVALPALFLVCAALEPEFRRRWAWALGAFAGTLALIASLQARTLGTYVQVRGAVNLGENAGTLLLDWGRSLLELLTGGNPTPYLGVEHWPAVAAWSLPALALGAWVCWKGGRRSLVLWALWAVALSQAGAAPWGLPSQRLVAAWPVLCLLAGAGAEALRARLPKVPAVAWAALLAVGVLLEANAFYRHMAFHGRQVWGRAELLAKAGHDAELASRQGASVCTALLEIRSPDARFLVKPVQGRGREAWVFLPPEFRVPAALAGGVLVYRVSPNDVPILVLRAQGEQAQRFEAVEQDLQPLLADESREDAWLARKGRGDDWAYAAVLDRHLRRLWTGLDFDQGLMDLVLARPAITPGPLELVGRYLVTRQPKAAALFEAKALEVDPLWGPALQGQVQALDLAGDSPQARKAEALRDQRFHDGAWQVYD